LSIQPTVDPVIRSHHPVNVSSSDPWFLYVREPVTGAARAVAQESWLIQAERCRVSVERSLPDAAIDLHFNLGPIGRQLFDHSKPRALSPRAAWVTGPHAQPIDIEKEVAHCDMVGVRLLPGVAHQLFGVAASELRDALVDLDLLWGRSAVEELRERLHVEENPRARLAIAERVIADRLSKSADAGDVVVARELCRSVSAMQHGSVSAAAAAHGLSHRRVIDLFEMHAGLKPKEFHRVTRLRRVLDQAHAAGVRSWTQIAHTCGYYDQAHLVNEFRSLTGITPGEYLASRSSVGRGFVPHRLAADLLRSVATPGAVLE
jgi:AraC-like DNA-binding protein